MLLEILLGTGVGICLGIITGLTPGIHINLVSLLLFSVSPFLLGFISLHTIIVMIIGMAVTHTFLDTIPSIFLGAPDADVALAVLPGHQYLREGKGYEAIVLTVIGSLASLIIVIALAPVLGKIVTKVYPLIKNYIGYILIVVSLFLILQEKKSRTWALVIFLLAGVLGVACFNISFLKNPLFPLLSGLFGISMLVVSLTNESAIPKQEATFPEVKKAVGYQTVGAAVFIGSIASFLPGLGPSQAAILGSLITRNIGSAGFLMLVGGLSTVNMVVSFVTLSFIEKARNGAVVIISQLIESVNMIDLVMFLSVTLITAGCATYLALMLARMFSKFMSKVNYKKLCLGVIAFITILVIILSGFIGFLVLVVATCLGIVASLRRIGKNHLMGCLLLPVILYFVL